MMGVKNNEIYTDLVQSKSPPESNKSGKERRIGQYIIEETLGKGRYSVVMKGVNYLTGTPVALKVVAKNSIPESDLKILVREMQIMKLLNHPNIVKLYEVIDHKNGFCLVLVYVDGQSLGHIIDHEKEAKKICRTNYKKWMLQLSSAVAYCHSKHVCHRDIKPDNIMITSSGDIKLADFGFSNIATGLFETHCGTPYFAAPELFRRDPYYGPGVDVWALGVLLYYIHYGILPFDGQYLKQSIRRGNFHMPSSSPSELRSLIKSALEVDPKKRTSAESIFQNKFLRANLENDNHGNNNFINNYTNINAKYISRSKLLLDEDIIGIMKHMGFHRTEIEDSIDKNLYNQVASTYYLLLDSPDLEDIKKKFSEVHTITPTRSFDDFSQSNDQTTLSISRSSSGSYKKDRKRSNILNNAVKVLKRTFSSSTFSSNSQNKGSQTHNTSSDSSPIPIYSHQSYSPLPMHRSTRRLSLSEALRTSTHTKQCDLDSLNQKNNNQSLGYTKSKAFSPPLSSSATLRVRSLTLGQMGKGDVYPIINSRSKSPILR